MEIPENARDMFCFAVYGATHAINRAYTPLLKPLGLTYPQYITLTLLWEKDGQSVNEIAKQLGMESNTLTPLLKRLEASGHLTRNRGAEDERQVFVFLTNSGKALKKEAREITRCMITATGMSYADLDELVDRLTNLTHNLSVSKDANKEA
ncbi:MAG: MarR family transcriptional regulator [Pseudomonadota bacterium]